MLALQSWLHLQSLKRHCSSSLKDPSQLPWLPFLFFITRRWSLNLEIFLYVSQIYIYIIEKRSEKRKKEKKRKGEILHTKASRYACRTMPCTKSIVNALVPFRKPWKPRSFPYGVHPWPPSCKNFMWVCLQDLLFRTFGSAHWNTIF